MPKPKTSGRNGAQTNGSAHLNDNVALLTFLDDRLTIVPEEWQTGSNRSFYDAYKQGDLMPDECTDFDELKTYWEEAMSWTEGLNRGLIVSLAVCLSTMQKGSQLWVKLIGPPSCGKTTIAEALSVNKQHVIAKSTMTGFHSGFRMGGEDGEDASLLAAANYKTLITKDGDALLTQPNLSQILSEARDLYDRVARTHYRNNAGKDYDGLSMTWLLCGTSSLRGIDDSELGERFLDCVIMQKIDDALEDAVLGDVLSKASRDLVQTVDGNQKTQYAPTRRKPT